MKKQLDNRKTLFVKFQDGTLKRVSIPSGCKITFGPLCPGTKGEHNGNHATALRVYLTKEHQIACFVKVESFYETDSVTCISKRTKRAQRMQAVEEGGVVKHRNVEVAVSEWRNELEEESDPDASGAFLALKYAQDDALKPF